ncbi:MAG TPA: DUF6036 family nucleotidyltransferase [Candidatus Nanoarchaeia archaeon]|nr:hypothetical protein [Candidatus Woesearchaeota archaeon]HIH12096.1 hypothetical protein [Candidatus Woesearchaeota archaeon]HLC71437.1 DUF6036 family nucleotidyltransferase [Candidatus Nanoarchaeia archaeon]
MITIDQQQQLLLNVSRRLGRKVTVYAIGGTAMMFLGFKDATLDIDLVFEDEKDKEVFKEAVISLGYQEMDAIKVYGAKRNRPEMFKLDDERFDLFVVEVIDFIFSENIQKRAEQIHQFGDTLILKIANPHDIILMKCATDRLKDKDDARKIINSTKINWDIIIEEAKHQMELGKERAVFDVTCFLEDLRKMMDVNIPPVTLEKLFELVERQAKEKKKKLSVH